MIASDRNDSRAVVPDALPLARALIPLLELPSLDREMMALTPMPHARALEVFDGRLALRRVINSWLLPHVADVTVHDDGSWQPGGADPVVVVPIWHWPPHDLVDLAAIDLRTDRTYLRTGMGDALGQHRVNSVDQDVTLVLHDSPTAWLRCGGLGICPLSPAFLPHLLGRRDITLVTHSLQAGETLRQSLIAAMPALPKIAVRGAAT